MWYKVGTINVINGSTTVTGTSTFWNAQVKSGDIFSIDNARIYEIETVVSDTELTLGEEYEGTTQSSIPYNIIRNFTFTTNSELAVSIADLINTWNVRDGELSDWTGGTIDGGPNNDGDYPLTDPYGITHLVACPAKIYYLSAGSEAAKGFAEEWANSPEDTLVSVEAGGDGVDDYSALHHASKAAADAILTAADRVQTGLDRAQTTADVVTTTADRVQTTADRVQTGLDRAQTTADRIATNADVVTTNNDVLTTTNLADAAAMSESNALTYMNQTNAAKIAVETIFDNFDDRFLGNKTEDPTTDNDGDPLQAGTFYYNTVTESLRFYNGSSWEDPVASAAASAAAALSSANAAALSESQTIADAAATAADRIQVAADTLLTLGYKNDAEAAATLAATYVHDNMDILNGTEESFTTALKSNYDSAYTYSQVGHLPLAGGTITGIARAESGGYFQSANPTNNTAVVSLDWNADSPRLRVGGSGTGSAANFKIQGVGDVDRMSLDASGNVDFTGTIKTLSAGTAANPAIKIFDDDLGFYKSSTGEISFAYAGYERIRFRDISTAAGQIAVDQYSVADTADNYPAYSFVNDLDSGMYLHGDGVVGLAVGGAGILTVDSTGANVVGSFSVDELRLLDGEKIIIGTDSDLQLYHDGTNSYIEDVGTGSLFIKGTEFRLQTASGENYLLANSNSYTKLYYDNTEKLSTTTDGISVSGSIGVTNIVTNKIVKFSGTVFDDSIMTDDGSTVTVSGNVNVTGGITSGPSVINHTSGFNGLVVNKTDDNGSRDGILIKSETDRDAGLTITTAGGSYQIWVDSYGDDSLWFSPGIEASTPTLELYQDMSSEFNGNVTVNGSLTLGSGVTLSESTDRADLLSITSSTSGLGGLQITNTLGEGIWSFMTDNNTAGIYDDQNSDWAILCYELGGVYLNYAGSTKLTTATDGVIVTGLLTATQKSFTIDHPTKDGMKLRYGSLEGPENGVYVRGNSIDRIIELPEYWVKLVDPNTITVQLTPIGKMQKLYVEKIDDNKVYIKNGSWFSNYINCSYVIYGERADVSKLEVEF